MKNLRRLILLLVVSCMLGCGGGNNTSRTSGELSIQVNWPSASRLIPTLAQSIRISVLANRQEIRAIIIPKPANGTTITNTRIENLPAISLDIRASAFPSTDGSGIAQASGTSTAQVLSTTTAVVSIKMDSTIATVEMLPALPSVAVGKNSILTVTAKDSTGALVLTDPSKWTWTSDNSGVIAVQGNGSTATLSGITIGTANITAVETESGKSSHISVSSVSHIAFVNVYGGTWEVFVMDSNGNNVRRLTTNTGIAGNINVLGSRPSWFPGESKLAFTNYHDGNGEIYTINFDGTGLTRLTNNSVRDFDASVSPDGKKIAFVRDINGVLNVWVMNSDGTGQVQLTSTGTYNGEPVWSPSGSQIAFATSRTGNLEIFVMNSDGSNPHNLTNNSAIDEDPAWSPDGTKIAFIRHFGNQQQVFTMNTDGSNQVNISNDVYNEDVPYWSPDGSQIAYLSTQNQFWEIYVMKADGSGKKRLTFGSSNSYYPSYPTWSH